MPKTRRIIIMLVIAILFSVFVFTSINAVYPEPKYGDYCDNRVKDPYPSKPRPGNHTCKEQNFNETQKEKCREKGGEVKYKRDENYCPTDWECSFCQKNYNEAREKHKLVSFLVSAILGLIVVIIGLYLPEDKESVHEWVGSGLMLGGLITIFTGTVMFFSDLNRWLRPVIILLELLLVIYLAYRKLGPDE